MIVERKDSGKSKQKTLGDLFYTPKWAPGAQRQVFKVKTFDFQEPGVQERKKVAKLS